MQNEINAEPVCTLEPRLNEILNKDISIDELQTGIDSLKSGKAVAEDQICNEFIKSSGPELLSAIQKLFN